MKAEECVEQLTIEEKISLLSETAPAIERMGIRRYHHGNEALHGVVRPGRFTVFPQAIGMGASFNPGLIQEVAEAISDEARARHNENGGEMLGGDFDGRYNGLLTFWSPNLNVARDPRWGRTGETYGEDPCLVGICGTAFIKGLQGENAECLKTVATPKHFVGNNEEHNRFECNASIPEDQYFDYYLKPFEIAVKEGRCESVMAAYNGVNGVPCHADRRLLTGILREQWGFQGYVVSDCGAVSHLWDRHRYVQTPMEAAAAALNAGVDLECGSCGTIQQVYGTYLLQALQEGLVTEKRIDEALLRVLHAREKLGILGEEKHTFDFLTEEVLGCEKHQKLALQMAEESLVLLKNDMAGEEPILPIDKGRTICVVGSQSDTCQFGDYSGQPIHAPISILEGLREEFMDTDILVVPYEKDIVGEQFEVIEREYLYHYEGTKLSSGIRGNYETQKGDEVSTRIDSRIAFEWENMAPDPLIQKERFRISWKGILLPMSSGEYQFLVKANEKECACKGRHQLLVDGILVHSETLSLEAGREYALELQYENIGRRPSIRLLWRKAGGGQKKRFQREREAAGRCDVVVACVGFGTEQGAEGNDRMALDLPDEQMEMLKAVWEVNKNLIVTLYNGSSLTIPWLAEHAAGILECWYPGEQGGRAIAHVLSGRVNPGGRLPLTFYRDVEDLPPFSCYDISKGFTYQYAKEVLYPFGYGLSYTDFACSNLILMPGENQMAGRVTISNQGKVGGYETIQIYAGYGNGEPRKLVHLDKVWLEPGETREIAFCIPDSRLAVWDTALGKERIREGCYRFCLAGHAEKVLLEKEWVYGGKQWNR